MRAGAAYWSYRSFMKEGNASVALSYLDIALNYPTGFYGVMAMQITGQTNHLDSSRQRRKMICLAGCCAQRVALAMLQVGNHYEASREIRYLYDEMPEALRRELIGFAVDNGMADLAFRVSDYHRYQTGEEILGGLYPRLNLATDLYVDEALVFAIIRKESGFSLARKAC